MKQARANAGYWDPVEVEYLSVQRKKAYCNGILGVADLLVLGR